MLTNFTKTTTSPNSQIARQWIFNARYLISPLTIVLNPLSALSCLCSLSVTSFQSLENYSRISSKIQSQNRHLLITKRMSPSINSINTFNIPPEVPPGYRPSCHTVHRSTSSALGRVPGSIPPRTAASNRCCRSPGRCRKPADKSSDRHTVRPLRLVRGLPSTRRGHPEGQKVPKDDRS